MTLESVGKEFTVDEHVSGHDTDVGSLSENVEKRRLSSTRFSHNCGRTKSQFWSRDSAGGGEGTGGRSYEQSFDPVRRNQKHQQVIDDPRP